MSGTITVPICSRQGKDTKSRFEVIFNGWAYNFYNKESGMYMCRGSIDSSNGQVLVAQALNSDNCWIEIEWLVHGLHNQDDTEDVLDPTGLEEGKLNMILQCNIECHHR